MIFLEGQFASQTQQPRVDPEEWLNLASRPWDLCVLESQMQATADALSELLDTLPPEQIAGPWVDICSGNGLPAIEVGWPRGMDLLHIDQNGSQQTLLHGRLAYYMKINPDMCDDEDNTAACRRAKLYMEGNFVKADVHELAKDPGSIKSQVPEGRFQGALILNPWDSVIDESLELALQIISPKAPIVIVTDASDHDITDSVAKHSDFFAKVEIYEHPAEKEAFTGIIIHAK